VLLLDGGVGRNEGWPPRRTQRPCQMAGSDGPIASIITCDCVVLPKENLAQNISRTAEWKRFIRISIICMVDQTLLRSTS
jgi:hypothetical protein